MKISLLTPSHSFQVDGSQKSLFCHSRHHPEAQRFAYDWKKKPKAKKKLDVIQETIDEGDEGDDPSTIKFLGVDLDQEHAEALEAFDAIALSRKGKVPSNPNGLISVKPSTSSQSATTSRKGSGRKRK